MKLFRLRLVFVLLALCSLKERGIAQQKKLVLWYSQPAKDWNEALPIGNGRLGAMVFGRPAEELIQLNEETLWTGGPAEDDPNPGAPGFLRPVREALFRDSIGQAVRLLRRMQGPNTEMYQPLGDIIIRQSFTSEPTNLYRDLDLNNAVSTTRFRADGIDFSREIFSSAPDQVIVIRLRSEKPKGLNFSICAGHELRFERITTKENHLVLKGKARIHNDERRNPKPLVYEDSLHCAGMRFQFRIRPLKNDGSISRTDSTLVFAGATEVVLLVSAATSYNGYERCPDSDGKNEEELALNYLQAAARKNYVQLLNAHVADYRKYFDRLNFSITDQPPPKLPVNERLAAYKKGAADPGLEELYFQFGRYLLISSSRPGGIPANLQGIWNHNIRPSWRSNYTTNINVQMNYWLAEGANLSEMTEPLISQIERWAKKGRATAKNYYNMKGWALHHNSDIWAQTNPVGEGNGDPKWANWSLGSPWLSQHLFEHYLFTSDKKFLREKAYPIMKGAAEFCLDWLVEKDGLLVTAPSTSPENVYLHPNGFKGTVTIASAMDMEIIWDLFTNLIEASTILGIDHDYAKMLEEKRKKLSPLKIGKKGNLVEWYGDWEDEDPQHRHVSHLFGLHPGRQIAPLLDPLLAEAARKTLEMRGDGGTGWSKAWKINFWARLLDGNHAYTMYQELLKTSTLNNLFDTHPPFQIDGNFGATAGILEMLVQSHLDEIHILPALPSAWARGSVKGIVARGAFVLDLKWKEGRIEGMKILSKAGNHCTIRSTEKILVKTKGVKVVSSQQKKGGKLYYLTSFPTAAGKTYELIRL